ncbi:hypothetical protein [Anaerorhabdus sp.]|uniref:hypothetical protein n=1 Tax=Anaerorhabdus sp. TaxID=1872524 RepID=UPI002FC64AA0
MSRKESDDLFEAMRRQVSAITKNKGCKLISKKQVEEMEINIVGSTTSYQPQTTIFLNDVQSIQKS